MKWRIQTGDDTSYKGEVIEAEATLNGNRLEPDQIKRVGDDLILKKGSRIPLRTATFTGYVVLRVDGLANPLKFSFDELKEILNLDED